MLPAARRVDAGNIIKLFVFLWRQINVYLDMYLTISSIPWRSRYLIDSKVIAKWSEILNYYMSRNRKDFQFVQSPGQTGNPRPIAGLLETFPQQKWYIFIRCLWRVWWQDRSLETAKINPQIRSTAAVKTQSEAYLATSRKKLIKN